MALQIKTTGIEDYMRGGSANIKMLVIGGPDAGKTRMSSFWPRPIYADCEHSRASIADRNVPYVDIKGSKDMLDLLSYLKTLEAKPRGERPFLTLVIDTLDGFQRKVKDEWLQANNAESFRGYDAWGYLDSKMQMLMTRALNLDYNVVVLVHYKDKTIKDDDGNESRELMLQLQGDIKDTAFNDFDLVGWLGTYWAPDEETGERVEKRGLTFKKTPDRPFLKDRFHVTPKWMEIKFADSDYSGLFEAFLSRVDELKEGETVGDVPEFKPNWVPGQRQGGPAKRGTVLQQVNDLNALTKQELQKKCDELKIPYKANTIKSELIEAIEAKQKGEQAPAETDAQPAQQPAETPAQPEPEPEPETSAEPEPDVDKTTGEIREVTPAGPVEETATDEQHEQAVKLVEDKLGGEVISDTKEEPKLAEDGAKKCTICGKKLVGQEERWGRLSEIRRMAQAPLCQSDFLAQSK